jgi:hypothetical protein
MIWSSYGQKVEGDAVVRMGKRRSEFELDSPSAQQASTWSMSYRSE